MKDVEPLCRLRRHKDHSAARRITSKKNSSDTNIGSWTRDFPACGTVREPTVPRCTARYEVFTYLYISNQSLSLLTDFSNRDICLSVCLFSTEVFWTANVLTLTFAANNSRSDAHSRTKTSGFSFQRSRSALLIEENCILSGILDRCDNNEALNYASLLRPH